VIVGTAILFVLTIAGSAILAFYVFTYAANCYLVVVQETSAGLDQVVWADEPIHDRLGRSFHVIVLVLLWLAPAGILTRALRHQWLADQSGLRFILLAVPGLWLLFPLGMLSSLAGPSPWIPVRGTVLRGLVRIFPAVLGFYFFTALLVAGAAGLWYLALFRYGLVLVPVASAVGAAVFLIHARLLGRIGWLLQRLPAPKRTRPHATAKKETPQKRKARRKRATQTTDPWAIPEGEESADTPNLPVEPYGVAAAERPNYPDFSGEAKAKNLGPVLPKSSPAPLPPPSASVPEEGYEVEGADPTSSSDSRVADRSGMSENQPSPAEREERAKKILDHIGPENVRLEQLLLQREEEYVPPQPLFTGVYTFPWYAKTVPVWLALVLGGMGVSFGILAMISLSPV
jgi:hypothetical protein